MTDDFKYLSVELADTILEHLKGRYGHPDAVVFVKRGMDGSNLFESAVSRPMIDYYMDFPSKAAALWGGLCTNHPLVDGNKRFGLVATEVFIALNNKFVDLSHEEALAISLGVARNDTSEEALALFLGQRLHTRSLPMVSKNRLISEAIVRRATTLDALADQ